jgi:hypothetical protein
MRQMQIFGATVEADVEATAEVYRITSRVGAPADCTCSYCRNLRRADAAAFPDWFLQDLNRLGIDFRKAAETCSVEITRNALYHYSGWYHFIGNILSEPTHPDYAPGQSVPNRFGVGLRTRRDIAFQEFGDRPLVQVEFGGFVPWILDEPAEPD